MRREHVVIAQNVAVHLREVERIVDRAMASTARLIATTLDARIETAGTGHMATGAMNATISQRAASRRMIIEAHEALDEARRVVGLAERAFGGGDTEVPNVAEPVERPANRAA